MEQQNETTTQAPASMPAITIGRFDADPTALGVIRPADDSWQLVIDKDGYPVFYFRVNVGTDAAPDVVAATAMMCVDDLLPPEMGGLKDIMKSIFSGEPTPEEAQECFDEFQERIATANRPCPR